MTHSSVDYWIAQKQVHDKPKSSVNSLINKVDAYSQQEILNI